jgi:23S rRNA pseudouridine2605 synthase
MRERAGRRLSGKGGAGTGPGRGSRSRAAAPAPDAPAAGEGERLHKVLARAGLGSRREIEGWMEAGRVTVNGEPVGPGQPFHGGDLIAIDGRPVPKWKLAEIDRRVIAYYKPVGEVCTRKDEEGRPTVFDHLPRLRQGRWVAIGRLDLNTQGLLLFTNDGALAHGLMHPSREVEREYAVRVLGEFPPVLRQKLLDGVELDDGHAHFERLDAAGGEGANQWWHVMLREGRQREVRRLFEAVGLTVSRLIRVRYGSCVLTREHRTGHVWELEPDEANALAELAGVPVIPVERKPAPARGRAAPGREGGRLKGSAPARGSRTTARASDGTMRAESPRRASTRAAVSTEVRAEGASVRGPHATREAASRTARGERDPARSEAPKARGPRSASAAGRVDARPARSPAGKGASGPRPAGGGARSGTGAGRRTKRPG